MYITLILKLQEENGNDDGKRSGTDSGEDNRKKKKRFVN